MFRNGFCSVNHLQTLTNGHKLTTSFAGTSDEEQPNHLDLSRSLSSLSFSEMSPKSTPTSSMDSSCLPTPTFLTPQSKRPQTRPTPSEPGLQGGVTTSINFEPSLPRVPLTTNLTSSSRPGLPLLGKPPALPPKTPTTTPLQPPPRPASKELRLDDILRWELIPTLSIIKYAYHMQHVRRVREADRSRAAGGARVDGPQSSDKAS